MTIKEALASAVTRLENADITGVRLDTQLLLGHVLGRDRASLLAHDTDELDPQDLVSFQTLIDRRANYIPVVHLTGTREFYGLDFKITPDVLTPRIETEQMVEWAIKYAPHDSRLIDIGTGSGAIAIAIASHRPDLHITATEVSGDALKIAQLNAKTHKVEIRFLTSDLWQEVYGRFETIVTNLPYLRADADLMPEVRREPSVALFGGPDGLDLYRRFLEGVPKHLASKGYLFTESDPWQHDSLTKEASKFNLTPIEQGYFILGFQRQ